MRTGPDTVRREAIIDVIHNIADKCHYAREEDIMDETCRVVREEIGAGVHDKYNALFHERMDIYHP